MCSSCQPVGIWDDGLDWSSQPPELRALGKRRAEHVLMRMMNKKVEHIDAELEAKHATMTLEDIAAEEQAAHEHLQAMASESAPARRWFDKK